MRNVLLFFLTVALLAACKEQTNLEAEVMAIHDEVMPKMGDIHLAKKNLKELLANTNNETRKNEIVNIITDLETADEGMMVWMSEWKVPENEDEKYAYLLKEKEKITKVKQDMLTSLKEAHNFIKQKSIK